MDLREQRVRFVVAAHRREKSFAELCREFDISRPAGYEWLRRYEAGGVEAIAERSRRPQRSPQRKDETIQQKVIALRRRYPDWGARKLRVLLSEQGVELARNTIHRILLRHGLVHPEDRHELAAQRFERGCTERAVADGLQRPEAVAPGGRAAVGAGRPQPLPDRAAGGGQHAQRAGAGAVGERLSALRGTGGDADGPRGAVVECVFERAA